MAELDTSKGGGHKKGKGKKRTKKASTRVDLTPMVDLGFLLVTFFMLTTTFSKPQTMEINMPVKDPTEKGKGQDTKASQTMTIILGDNNKVFWFKGLPDTANYQTTDYSAKGLRSLLVDMNKTTKDLVCIIKPTDKSTYKNMVDVLDEMSIIGIKRYALVNDFIPIETEKIKNL
jgi:biopolymer transport protein ExbD